MMKKLRGKDEMINNNKNRSRPGLTRARDDKQGAQPPIFSKY